MKAFACRGLRTWLQDRLDRGEAAESEAAAAHLAACPDCRAWRETLLSAAAGLRGALEAAVAVRSPPDGAARRVRDRAAASRRARRRLTGLAAALALAAGLGAAGAGFLGRRAAPSPAEAGGDYLLEVLFADSLHLEDPDPGPVPVPEGNGGWLAGTLESGSLYSMEPLTLF